MGISSCLFKRSSKSARRLRADQAATCHASISQKIAQRSIIAAASRIDQYGGIASPAAWPKGIDMITVKRLYDPVSPDDGLRVLVDRLWPRGLSKANAHVDLWLKDIAPSHALRQWYAHEPAKWAEFCARYKAELALKQAIVDELRRTANGQTVTLLYSSREPQRNNAHALKAILEP
jgi:uncharacterized protein YeaO (DUF488 family)